jgi:hypothetical protein
MTAKDTKLVLGFLGNSKFEGEIVFINIRLNKVLPMKRESEKKINPYI